MYLFIYQPARPIKYFALKFIRLLFLIFIEFGGSLFSSEIYCQDSRPQPVLLVFFGESNSGGQAFNSEASAMELAPRARVQILNNRTFCFEALDIGTNNNIDHFNLNPNDYHGWELELANRLYDGTLPNDTIYLVKAGQGGSSISQWADSGTYYSKFRLRLDTAIAKLTRQYSVRPNVAIFYSQGINDALIPTRLDKWKTGTIELFARIRERYGNVPVYIPYFMTGFEKYNIVLDQIAGEVERITMIHTASAHLQDAYHWSYEGMKVVADSLINSWSQQTNSLSILKKSVK